jgi:RNA polymerase sigma factor for flagellar operon FliA
VRLGRPATDEEIARELGIPVGELDGLLSEVSLATIMSLDADPNGDDEQQSGMGDYLPDPRSDDVERSIAEQEMRELIAHRLAELPEKEQLVLVLYYYEELTLKEIGEILDVTESRVCQIHTKAILRLKGKIDRHEGKTSIGRLTSEIQQRRPSILDPLAVKVNIMAGLVLAPLASLAVRLISGPPA